MYTSTFYSYAQLSWHSRQRWHWSGICMKNNRWWRRSKKRIRCVLVEPCGEDKLLSLPQSATLPATEYTACILTKALNKHWQNTCINQKGTHINTASPFKCPHSWGSFTQLFNYLFVNLVSLQISLGDKIILSVGNQTSGYNGFGIHQHSRQWQLRTQWLPGQKTPTPQSTLGGDVQQAKAAWFKWMHVHGGIRWTRFL